MVQIRVKVNSVGVAVFYEFTRGHATRSAMVRVELGYDRHLSDTRRTTIGCHVARVTFVVAISEYQHRGPRHALTEVP